MVKAETKQEMVLEMQIIMLAEELKVAIILGEDLVEMAMELILAIMVKMVIQQQMLEEI